MIFPEKNEKRIPKTLNECMKPNSTVSELYLWAERVENWGHILLALLTIGGIILTIVEAVSLVDVNEDMIIPTIITSIITWGLYVFLAYCAYHAISLLLYALASITHHTMISANVALFESQNNSNTAEEKPKAPQQTPQKPLGNWKCPDCGNTIPYDVIRCKCGYEK